MERKREKSVMCSVPTRKHTSASNTSLAWLPFAFSSCLLQLPSAFSSCLLPSPAAFCYLPTHSEQYVMLLVLVQRDQSICHAHPLGSSSPGFIIPAFIIPCVHHPLGWVHHPLGSSSPGCIIPWVHHTPPSSNSRCQLGWCIGFHINAWVV